MWYLRVTRLLESYGEGRGRAIDHDAISAASSFAPADENVIANCVSGGRYGTASRVLDSLAICPHVFMIFAPALRFLTEPFPPGDFAARFLAAVILPPLLFFAIFNSPPS